MDTKNVIAAISLSAAVIILYGLFFAPEPSQRINNDLKEKKEIVQTSEAPTIDEEEKSSEEKSILKKKKSVNTRKKNPITSKTKRRVSLKKKSENVASTKNKAADSKSIKEAKKGWWKK